MEKGIPSTWNSEASGVEILMSNKIELKPKLIKRDGRDTSYLSKDKSPKMAFNY